MSTACRQRMGLRRSLGGTAASTERLDAHLREKYDAAVVPGHWFEMPDHFRVGFGLPTDEFEEALSRLRFALDDLE